MQELLAEFWETGSFTNFQGVNSITIECASFVVDDSQAGIVICSGRTECILKYQELVFELSQAGYSVFILDHRGQGLSGRIAKNNPLVGHVVDFDHYVIDLNTFVRDIVSPNLVPAMKLFLLGHSMGGCIASRYIEIYPNDFNAAILSSPMHQPSTGFIPEKVAEALTDIKAFFNKGEAYAINQGPPQNVPFAEVEDLKGYALTHDALRYERIRNLNFPKLGGPSNMWVHQAIKAGKESIKHADKIKVPVLLIRAGEDSIVTNEGQDAFLANLNADFELFVCEGGYHELFIESDEYRLPVVSKLISFIEEQLTEG